MNEIEAALAAWSRIVGAENVVTDAPALREVETATYTTHQHVRAVVRPADRDQVQACLRVAGEQGVPVYPVSSGKNWGYGSRVPPQDGCAILDLGRMNRILDYDEKLGCVTIEPGVTQDQLYQFLRERGGRFWLDATGTSGAASPLGNTAERGFGHTPYGDHFSHVCALEVVLPTGECIHTGFGRFANAQAAHAYRWGVGPYLDGLFTQSGFGVITRMTFWLMPAPEYFQAVYFSVERDDQLGPLIEALRPLRLNGTLRSAVHIANDYKILASIRQYPWEEAGGQTPLSRDVLARFAKAWDFGAWSGSGGLYGTRRQVAEARRLIKRALKGKVKRLRFLDARMLWLAQRLAGLYHRITGLNLPELLKLLLPVVGLMQGVPTDTQLASAYWRKKSPPPAEMNPDRDGCGLIWCAPVAPLDGRHAEAVWAIARETTPKYGFEPTITITLLTERALGCVIVITYDRDIPGEDERAMRCYQDIFGKLTEAGYYPYRLGVQSMEALSGSEESYQALLRTLRGCLDPKGILAPGRYTGRDAFSPPS